MADDTILLNGKSYQLARADLIPRGARRWDVSLRPSQATDPATPPVAFQWQTWGANFNSFEIIPPGQAEGLLSVDYTDDIDTRFDGIALPGPALTTIDCSGVGGAAANTNGFEWSHTMNATKFLYAIRGTKPAKVTISTMALATEASAALAEAATSILYTKAANGSEQISLGMRTTAYRTIDTVANAGVNDTHTVNAGGVKNAFFFIGVDGDRVFAAQDPDGTNPLTVRHNILTGAVTMNTAANWQTVGTIKAQDLKIQGLNKDGTFLVVLTNIGPYTVDPDYLKFTPWSPEIGMDDVVGLANGYWTPLGLVYDTKYALRAMMWGMNQSIGLERFTGNTSPVSGYVTAVAASERWLEVAYLNSAGNSYLLAGRPKQAGDWHDNPISWFCLRKVTNKTMAAGRYMGTVNGVRTLPFFVFGSGSDVVWHDEGRINRFPLDTSYTYATSGTWYGTESRRYPEMIKDIEALEFEAGGTMSANSTLTLGCSLDGAAAATLTGTMVDASSHAVNGVVKHAGFHRLITVNDAGVPLAAWSGRRLKPQILFTSNSAAAAPQAVGVLRLICRMRPLLQKVITVTVVLDQNGLDAASVAEMEANLRTAAAAGPVVLIDPEGVTSYVRVEAGSLQVQEVQETGSGRERGMGSVRLATLRLLTVPTAAGQ